MWVIDDPKAFHQQHLVDINLTASPWMSSPMSGTSCTFSTEAAVVGLQFLVSHFCFVVLKLSCQFMWHWPPLSPKPCPLSFWSQRLHSSVFLSVRLCLMSQTDFWPKSWDIKVPHVILILILHLLAIWEDLQEPGRGLIPREYQGLLSTLTRSRNHLSWVKLFRFEAVRFSASLPFLTLSKNSPVSCFICICLLTKI